MQNAIKTLRPIAMKREELLAEKNSAARLPSIIKIPQIKKRKILFVTSEYADLVKVGGLGDVSVALPKALAARHDVRILIPGYQQVMDSGYPIRVIDTIDAYAGLPACHIGSMQMENGPIIYVVICPELYQRPGNPYGDAAGNDWSDNPIRFARLGLAAAEIALGRSNLDWCPELVHANDWPAALAPAYMAWRGQATRSVFTIHNLAHQGLCDTHYSEALGLPMSARDMEGMEFYGKLSFIKAGIVYASHITTVSETYAREITMPVFGCGLDGLLRKKLAEGRLSGITNGIDESWQPDSDPNLVECFSSRQWERKQSNTRHIEQLFNLPASIKPLFAVVSRLAYQKGVDLTLGVIDTIVNAGGRLVVMGCGDAQLEKAMLGAAKKYPQHVGVHIGFHEASARRIFAASDFLLMPSRFEPCGLSQMYAQRCASLPIARRTGGLADTIEDGLNGFLFEDATVDSYRKAVQRALNVFSHPTLFNAMRSKAMISPLYWWESVKPYDKLYHRLLGQAGLLGKSNPGSTRPH